MGITERIQTEYDAKQIIGVSFSQLGELPPPAVPEWTIVASSQQNVTTNSFNVTIPGDTLIGDQIWVFTGGRSGSSFTPPGGAGYTELYDFNIDGNTSGEAWYRYATVSGGEVEAWNTQFDFREQILILLVIRGGRTAGDPLDVPVVQTTAYDDTPECPAITTITDKSLIIYTWSKRTSTTPTADTGYPPSSTGLYRRFYNESGMGLAYREANAGAIAAEDWAAIPAESNLWVAYAMALRIGG